MTYEHSHGFYGDAGSDWLFYEATYITVSARMSDRDAWLYGRPGKRSFGGSGERWHRHYLWTPVVGIGGPSLAALRHRLLPHICRVGRAWWLRNFGHFYSPAVEVSFYGVACEMICTFTKLSNVQCEVTATHDFLKDPANATVATSLGTNDVAVTRVHCISISTKRSLITFSITVHHQKRNK